MEINAPYQKDLSFSLMQPPMEYTCARASLFDAHTLPESLLHQQLEQHRPLESCCAEYSDLHHHHQHYHHHYQQQPPQLHHPRYSSAVGGYLGLNDEVMATELNPLPFDALSHHEKEKQGLPQNLYAHQYGGANVQAPYKLREDALIPDRTYEDPHFFPKTCEDAHAPPVRRDTLQFVCEERYQPQSPTRGSVSQFVREERYQPPQSPTRGEERYQPPQSPTRGSLSFQPRIKLLCSIGGKIMARPVDGKLRYCGGETRVIAVDRCISFVELIGKMTQIYGSTLILKYQLPGEDLDALVSVSSDDDLQNMLDEYDKLVASSGDSRLRLFLFNSPLQCDILSHCDIAHGREDCCAEVMQRYIDAINGLANNGLSELVAEVHLENGFNDASAHHRIPLDLPNTAAPGPFFSAKHSLRIPSAPSSVPSSPSIASRQAHYKQCGTGETCPQFAKDQPSCIPPMNGLDMSKQEASQDGCVDTSSTLKCDHLSHIPLESTRIQHDATLSRGDTKWVKENGTHFIDPQDLFVHHYGRQRGTGTVFVDTWRNTWHDIQKPSGLTNPHCEAHCGNHPTPQPLTSFTRQGPVEDEFGRVEAVQHGHSEGHKQLPVFLHQPLRQAISPLHCDGLTRLQRGPGYESSYQNIDGQGLSPSLQESGHPYGHSAHVSGTISMNMMRSAPSSPRDAVLGRCCCYRQHSQVHRGVSVSLGEHSHSKRPSHFGDQSSRKHGLPLLSRFCDGSNFFTDSATGHCPPKLDKGYELDDQDLLTSSRKHIFDRGSTRCHLAERSMYQCGCADYNDQKGQHVEKARGFPVSTEFQAHWGERVAHLGSNEIENANVRTAGNMIHKIPVQDHINIEVCKEGCMSLHSNHAQEELEMGIRSMHDGGGVSVMESLHVSQDPFMLGHNELDFDLNAASFSSMDAVAGSLSRPSLEPPVWVDSPPFAAKDEYLKKRDAGTVIPAVDCDESSPGMRTGDTCRSPSFSCMESYAARSRSTSTSGDLGEPRVEHLPVSSLIHLPNMHSLDKGSTLYAHGSHPDIDHSGSLGPSEPFPSRIVDSVTFDGSSVTLASPRYDQSPVSSVNKANFSFAQSEHSPRVNGINVDKEATSQICATEQCVTDRNTSTINPYSNDDGEHQEIGKGDDDTVPNKIFEQETKPVPEESRSFLEPSSTQLSTQAASYANVQILKIIPMVPSTVTCEIVQEVKVESGSLCSKEEEKELPATQAEAEAIARGLQIIKNDDLEDLKELGSGTYGTVFHGKWRGSDVAIKRIKASCFMGHPSVQERLISDFWREAGTLSQLHHPNIVAFYGVVPDGPGGTLATVTEYMVNGSLKQVLLKKDRTIDRKKRLLIAMDAAFGMEYLHSKKIVHFDLKSENLLVNMRDAHRPICKVGDFGLSKVKHQTLVSGGVRGTLPWMAPELLSGKSLVTEKVDVFSFGIVMWELLTGEEPYANMHCGTIIGGIVNDTLRPVIPSWCDPSWRDLMERCWSGNPADRPDFSVVANELRAIALSMNVK